MTTRENAAAQVKQVQVQLVRRMQECFNSRRFDQAADLHTPDFFSHPLGIPGFEAGKDAWRALVARFPDVRVLLVDGDKAAVRSTVEGITGPDGDAQPMLFEIFRIEDGRFAEMWGASTGFPPAASPEDVAAG
ncbi:nuclear transport factor 2 family protein [Microbispora sp. NEAU-D428]|uniref:ester cyclase n=1 Tax=Microbispora sitophila TaxID=2771537 RepID=UPI00186944EA|nr:nuclear transport factor 2 family protein [Microbispora sitophila]MBE3013030.1 nuclear transport factor 2 family protein [Microbispora sitophila]